MLPDRIISNRQLNTMFGEPTNPRTDSDPVGTPKIDLQRVIPMARIGDPDATAALYDYSVRIVYPALYKKAGANLGDVEMDELAESILEKLFTTVLERYDTTLHLTENKSAEQIAEQTRSRFTAYVTRMAHNRFVDSLRTKGRRNMHQIEIPRYNNLDNTAELIALPEVATLLTDQQKEVLSLRAKGLTIVEIGNVLGLSEGSVKLRSFRARQQVEKKFLTPKGLHRINTDDATMYDACFYGMLRALLFCRKYYVRDEWVKEHQKNHILPPIPEYKLVKDIAIDPAVRKHLNDNISHPTIAAVKRDNKLYAHPNNVAQYLREHPPKSCKPPIQVYPPNESGSE